MAVSYCDRHVGYRRGCEECQARARRWKGAYDSGHRRRRSAIGVARRLEALRALGWSMAAVSAETGIPESWLSEARRGRIAQTSPERVAVIAEAYDRLSMRPRRLREGIPPLAWDDETIDNPDATPAEGWQRTPASSLAAERAERAEAIRALSASGLTATEVGVRLGMRRDAVAQSLSRQKALQGDLSA